MLDHVAITQHAGHYGLRVEGGALWMEGVALHEIAATVGTPTYAYSAAAIEAAYLGLADAMSGRPTQLCYAMKANSSQAVLQLLARHGAGADIVSGGELQRALAAGITPNKIVFSGVGKTDAELDAAISYDIRSINVESSEELDRVAAPASALGRRAKISLRINPDVDPDTHPYLATGLRESKFGIAMDAGLELARKAYADENLDLVGLACHIGSQIVEAGPFLDSFTRLRSLLDALRDDGVKLRQLDLGGGLGIAYRVDEPVLDVREWGAALVEATGQLDLELVLEPGRYLVGNAGVLLMSVLGRKRGETRDFVIVDAAMNDLLRPALYQAYHAVGPARVPGPQVPIRRADLVGPVCESGDFLAKERELPWPERGDLWLAASAGAYGMTMASTYNTRPLPAEVLVHESSFDVIRPRKEVAELIAGERVPAWLEQR